MSNVNASSTHRLASPRIVGLIWLGAVALSCALAALATDMISVAVVLALIVIVVVLRRRVRTVKPFVWAIVGAGLFVLTRLGYRLLFGGMSSAPAGEHVIWSLPQVWLSGPFASIHLFGVMTVESVVDAVSSALVFAAVIIVFGAANTLADPRGLLDHAPRRLVTLAWSVSIALSVFPTIIRSATRINTGRRLRNDRGVASLVVPLLEQCIERSEQLGLSLSMRGLGVEYSPMLSIDAKCGSRDQVLRLDRVSASLAGEVLLREASLEAHPGSITVITGATGSGKTSLLQILRGVFTEAAGGETVGCATLGDAPVALSSSIALTLQRPENSFVAPTVRAEIAFAARQLVGDADDATCQVASRLGIETLLDRRIDALSAGEAALVGIAAALVTKPRVLLLDEPIADLDSAATNRVVQALRVLRDQAKTAIVIAEHRPERLWEITDRRYELSNGALSVGKIPSVIEHAGLSKPPVTIRRQQPVELCHRLSVPRGDVEVVRDATLRVHPSAVTALVGPNGCGKTTLLEALALPGGKPADGVVMVGHNVDDMLFRQTLADECRANDRNARVPAGSTEASIRRFLPALGSLDRHPRDCSAGTRVVLAVAMQLARSSCVLLLDEPTRGLDAGARAELADALGRATAAGNAVLIATHDEEFAAATAHHTVRMVDGRIIETSAEDTNVLDAPAYQGVGQ